MPDDETSSTEPTGGADSGAPVPTIDVEGPLFASLVEAAAWGEASTDDLAVLEAHKGPWQRELIERLNETDEALDQLRSHRRPDDQQVLADLEHEQRMLEIALDRLLGVEPEPGEPAPGINVLQLSWVSGRFVAWLGGPDAPPTSAEHLHAALAATHAPEDVWASRAPVPLPNGDKALAFEAATSDVLGWLLGIGAEVEPEELGPSVHWLALVAAWAVELVARGAMVPTMRRARTGRKNQNRSAFGVAWNPALIDAEHLKAIADAMPGSVAALVTLGRRPHHDPLGARPRWSTSSATAPPSRSRCPAAARRPPHPRRHRRGLPRPPRRRPVRRARRHRRRAHQRPRALGRAGHLQGLPRARRPARPARLGRRLAPRRCSRPAKGQQLVARRGRPRRRRQPAPRARGRARPPRAPLPAAAAAGQPPPRPGRAEPGRGVGAHDRHRPACSPPPASTCGCPRCRAASPRPSLRPVRRRRRRHASSAPTSSPTCAGRRCSTTSSSPPPTSPAWPSEARPLVRVRAAAGSRSTAPTSPRPPRRWPSGPDSTQLTGAEMLRHALGLEGSPLAGGVTVEGAAGPPTCCAEAADRLRRAGRPRPRASSASCAATRPRRWPGSASSTPPGSAAASPSTWASARRPRCSPTSLATAGDGPALVIAPPAVVGNWAAEAAAVHPRPAGRRAPRRLPRRGRRARRPRSPTPTSSSPPTAPPCATSTRSATIAVGPRRARRGAGHQEPGQRDRPAAAPHPRPHPRRPHRHADRERPRRPVGHPRLHQPRPRRRRARSSSPRSRATARAAGPQGEHALRALNGILVFRRTKTEPEVAAELPDRIDELDHCTMTPEQIGLYQAVLDRLVIGRDLPEDGAEPRKGQILAAITALKQICNHPAAYQRRRPAARRPLGQARPPRGDRRAGVRRRRAGAGLHPLRRVGRAARRPPHRAHRHAGRAATTAASPAAPATA